ncbi:ABC transporter permease [Halobacillus karajensis]|uniref:ABC-2 family transporter protein n=1 Tax=Halobacillus karajensis TaxID=195088 RepID=A0A059NZ83_9BACI|nr:ABC transporter permease [Halobacillus karajensis]CDQ21120.1 ABC-2 family transporter protein [Halobacillus karajensis]CDQ24816.1 ABC-2 family transporter protein [Halobacillus karajensis]CDQ28824.1 ABC-2 family transporter protein [Halobacillus karajensis]
MNKFFIMMGQTYKNRVKSKSFLITTIVTIALIFVLTNIQSIIETFSDVDEEKKVAVLTEHGDWYEFLAGSVEMNDQLAFEKYEGSLNDAKTKVEEGDYESVVQVEQGADGTPEGTYYANQIANTGSSEAVRQALQQLKVQYVTEQADVDPAVIQQMNAPISLELVALEDSAKTAEELEQTRGLVYVMLFFMYFSVIMYGQMISTEVATEKSSRVMEILISSVSPVSQMFAKILGIALLGLTQFGIFILVGYIGIQQSKDIGDGSLLDFFGFTNIDPSTVVYAVVFFLLGYLLYATLAATLGSLVSRLEDAQQMMAPMMMLVVAGFMIAMFGLTVPDAAFITVSSYFPFFTPLLMFLRVGMLDIPVWEVALSLGILVGSIALLGWIGARIYRGGVLMYGKSSSLKDLKTALQLSKKEH